LLKECAATVKKHCLLKISGKLYVEFLLKFRFLTSSLVCINFVKQNINSTGFEIKTEIKSMGYACMEDCRTGNLQKVFTFVQRSFFIIK